jgi:hypothetical protein
MEQFYLVAYGLGGGFGGAQHYYIAKFSDIDDAYDEARQNAIEEYERYGGMHGLYDLETLAELNGIDPDSEEAEEDYNDQMDSWLDYCIEEVYNKDNIWYLTETHEPVDMTSGYGVEIR